MFSWFWSLILVRVFSSNFDSCQMLLCYEFHSQFYMRARSHFVSGRLLSSCWSWSSSIWACFHLLIFVHIAFLCVLYFCMTCSQFSSLIIVRFLSKLMCVIFRVWFSSLISQRLTIFLSWVHWFFMASSHIIFCRLLWFSIIFISWSLISVRRISFSIFMVLALISWVSIFLLQMYLREFSSLMFVRAF